MPIKAKQYIELKGENPLRAVVRGTEANAHLVATNALVCGVSDTAEQYHMSEAQVYGAMAFYRENQELIDHYNAESEKHLEEIGMTIEEFKEKLRKRNNV